MSEQPQTQEPVKKTKRAHKSGSAAAKQVRRQSKSSAPIFFEKTVVHMVKDHTSKGTRITPGARRLLRSIIEQRTVGRAAKAYAVTKARRGKKGNVRLITRDLDLVSFLLDNTPMPEEEEEEAVEVREVQAEREEREPYVDFQIKEDANGDPYMAYEIKR